MPQAKPQIMIIHGAESFKTEKEYLRFLKTREISLDSKHRWHGKYLDEKLGRQCQIIRPRMPLAENARYRDWKIYFERFIPYLNSGVILIGNSMGGIFLAKYLSENRFPKPIRSAYLVCPPFNDSQFDGRCYGGFKLGKSLVKLEKSAPRLALLFSKQDKVVPPINAKRYAAKLSRAEIHMYPHVTGHFQVEKLPELVRMIRQDLKRLA